MATARRPHALDDAGLAKLHKDFLEASAVAHRAGVGHQDQEGPSNTASTILREVLFTSKVKAILADAAYSMKQDGRTVIFLSPPGPGDGRRRMAMAKAMTAELAARGWDVRYDESPN